MRFLLLILAASACVAQTVSPTRAFYVSTTGNSGNTGAIDSPWDLVSALTTKCSSLAPGNTIWLRGGTYSPTARIEVGSACSGTAALPVRVRGYPGESVIIDTDDVAQVLSVESLFDLTNASYVTIQGEGPNFRIYSSSTVAGSRTATASSTAPGRPQVAVVGTGASFINIVAHDLSQAFGPSSTQQGDVRVYGAKLWNIAFFDSNDSGSGGQCFYGQNFSNWFRISNSWCFAGGFNSLQVQGSTNASLSKFAVYNSRFVDGGAWRPNPSPRRGTNILAGGNGRNQHNIFDGNIAWTTITGSTVGSALAVYRRGLRWSTFKDNYFVGRSASVEPSQNSGAGWAHFLTAPTGNTYIPQTTQQDFIDNVSGNTNLTARPSSGKTFRYVKDIYTGIGGSVEVFNWDNSATVSVDLSQLGFVNGDAYTVRDAFNYLGSALATGTYSGGTVSVGCNQTVTQALVGPNPFTGAPDPPTHPNNDTGRLCGYIVEPELAVSTVPLSVNPQVTFPTVSRAVLQTGRTAESMTLRARPLQITLLRNTLSIVGASTAANLDDPPCNIDSASGLTHICGSRTNGGVYNAASSTVLITGVSSGAWTAINRAWSISATDPGADISGIALNSDSFGKFATCLAGACAGIKALWQPVSPAEIQYSGSILFTGDTLQTDGAGTSDWTAVNNYNSTITVPSTQHNGFTGPALSLAPAGPNTASSSGTTFTSTAHGLAVNEYIWVTSGAQNNQIRRVSAVPGSDTATLESAFPADLASGTTWRKIASDFGVVDGTPPAARVNCNPLMFEILEGSLRPGSTAPISISGGTGDYAALNGNHTATVTSNGRFTVPVNSCSWSSPAAQSLTVTATRWLDLPEQDKTCSSGCSFDALRYTGVTMQYRLLSFDSGGTLLGEQTGTYPAGAAQTVRAGGAVRSGGSVRIQ